eukprot:TRINITY_DN2995_c0_g1_i1.p1 TRINITY_DN2995_c0_g1~~TRINITY_DN2995_c0_g1_i1.p1  ORF type:complete len:1242 (-),score=158.64 TRINITY_DN2995_c0_g1_i1:463-4188(-)
MDQYHGTEDYRTNYSNEARSEVDRRFRDILARAQSRHYQEELFPRRAGESDGLGGVGGRSAAGTPGTSQYDETRAMMEKLRSSITNLSEQIDDSLSPHSVPIGRGPATGLGGSSAFTYSSPARNAYPLAGAPSHVAPSEDPRTFGALRGRAAAQEWMQGSTTGGYDANRRFPATAAAPTSTVRSNTLGTLGPSTRLTPSGLEAEAALPPHSHPSSAHYLQPPTHHLTSAVPPGNAQVYPSPSTASANTSIQASTGIAPRGHSTLVVSSILQELEEDRSRMSTEVATLERENAQLKESQIKQQGHVDQLQHQLHTTEAKNRIVEQELESTRYDLSCLRRDYEAASKRNDLLTAEVHFLKFEKKEELEQDRNYLAFLQTEKQRMQHEIEVLKHTIQSILDIAKLGREDLDQLGLRFDANTGLRVTGPPTIAPPALSDRPAPPTQQPQPQSVPIPVNVQVQPSPPQRPVSPQVPPLRPVSPHRVAPPNFATGAAVTAEANADARDVLSAQIRAQHQVGNRRPVSPAGRVSPAPSGASTTTVTTMTVTSHTHRVVANDTRTSPSPTPPVQTPTPTLPVEATKPASLHAPVPHWQVPSVQLPQAPLPSNAVLGTGAANTAQPDSRFAPVAPRSTSGSRSASASEPEAPAGSLVAHADEAHPREPRIAESKPEVTVQPPTIPTDLGATGTAPYLHRTGGISQNQPAPSLPQKVETKPVPVPDSEAGAHRNQEAEQRQQPAQPVRQATPEPQPARTSAGSASLPPGITLYLTSFSTNRSEFDNSKRIMHLLGSLNVPFFEVDFGRLHEGEGPAILVQAGAGQARRVLCDKSGVMSLPQLFVGDRFIGTFDEIVAVHDQGKLFEKLGIPPPAARQPPQQQQQPQPQQQPPQTAHQPQPHQSQAHPHGLAAAVAAGPRPGTPPARHPDGPQPTQLQLHGHHPHPGHQQHHAPVTQPQTQHPSARNSVPQSAYLSPRMSLGRGGDDDAYTHHSDDYTALTDAESDMETSNEMYDSATEGRSGGPASRGGSATRGGKQPKRKEFCSACNQLKISSFYPAPPARVVYPRADQGPPLLCSTCNVPPELSPVKGRTNTVQNCVDGLKRGYPLLKFNLSNAKATRKWVALSPDNSRLVWASKPNAENVAVLHLSQVYAMTYNFLPTRKKGLDQPAFVASEKRHLRLSLVTTDRSVDFEALSREVFIIVYVALHSLIYPQYPPMSVGRVLWKIAAHLTTSHGKRPSGIFQTNTAEHF